MINLYQTWKTQNLHSKILKIQKNMLAKNLHLNHIIYTNEQMEDFVYANFEENIIRSFKKINNMVAKADFWRYLILYKFGGIYLDIDSLITSNISNFEHEPNIGYISFESNNKKFIQWSLIYGKNHIILEKCIQNIVDNINEKVFKNDISNLTGPDLYTNSRLSILNEESIRLRELLNAEKNNSKLTFKIKGNKIIFIPSSEYNKYFLFKHKYTHLLNYRKKGTLENSHWTIAQQKNEIYK